jgi:predicted nucleic acid-binding protein
MMDNLFFDTNVVLDLLGEREPFYESVAKIASLADKGKLKITVSALTYSTVFYLLSRFEDGAVVKEKIRKFKVISETADLTDRILEKGLNSNFKDYEDSLQYYSALSMECSILITRNGKDFKDSAIPVLTPQEYIQS